MNKSVRLDLRITELQKRVWEAAAVHQEKTLSQWIRDYLDLLCRRHGPITPTQLKEELAQQGRLDEIEARPALCRACERKGKAACEMCVKVFQPEKWTPDPEAEHNGWGSGRYM